jgi:hypothetical protein
MMLQRSINHAAPARPALKRAVALRVVALQAPVASAAHPLARNALNTTNTAAKNALNQLKNALQKNVHVIAVPE